MNLCKHCGMDERHAYHPADHAFEPTTLRYGVSGEPYARHMAAAMKAVDKIAMDTDGDPAERAAALQRIIRYAESRSM